MNQKILYHAGRYAMKFYARTLLDVDIVKMSPLPDGPKIIAPNHPTTMDPFLVTTWSAEPIHFLVTESAFKVPLFRWYLRSAGHIPVISGRGKEAFDAALDILREGNSVAIFPEGALSPIDGGYQKPHTGAARLSIITGAPVVPVGIAVQPDRIHFLNTGIADSQGQPEIARLYSRAPYAVTIGTPLYFEGGVEDRTRVRLLTHEIMRRINHLRLQSDWRISTPAVRPATQAYHLTSTS